ncbi:MAG TPA: AAA family ATPase [Polyangiaceae bacterium]|nr:AAA family ATPase [Polyangiaceae bacterium]
MNKKLLSLYGLKWNPFSPEVPIEALSVSPRLDSFCWRVEQLVGEGGFALITGASGLGKSVTLRLLAERLGALRDVQVGVLSRPHASVADFYRQMGDLFGVELHPHNRWCGAKLLRERWQAHIDTALSRPVLLIDEAQEMKQIVLGELRLLSSARLDSHLLLTVVLAGDRLIEYFRCEELLPLFSRMRVRLTLERATPEELWSQHAVGIVGAEPKCCKSFLALDLAVAVATPRAHSRRPPRARCSGLSPHPPQRIALKATAHYVAGRQPAPPSQAFPVPVPAFSTACRKGNRNCLKKLAQHTLKEREHAHLAP